MSLPNRVPPPPDDDIPLRRDEVSLEGNRGRPMMPILAIIGTLIVLALIIWWLVG